jgi:hypothetical protein
MTELSIEAMAFPWLCQLSWLPVSKCVSPRIGSFMNVLACRARRFRGEGSPYGQLVRE